MFPDEIDDLVSFDTRSATFSFRDIHVEDVKSKRTKNEGLSSFFGREICARASEASLGAFTFLQKS
ncbi:hypothetical protein ASG59_18615 [Methylobacterium sp. Leaf466]|nr:hypothetical protein ASG59_18615 [Methylobacterium sp. Leaf466]